MIDIRIYVTLIGKVKTKFQQFFLSRIEVQTLVELCAIRDGLSTCNTMFYMYLDVYDLFNVISLDRHVVYFFDCFS